MAAGPAPEQTPVAAREASPRPLLFLLIAICTILVVSYAMRLDERDRVEAAIVAQQQANAQAVAREAALLEELALASRPSHLDEIARTHLNLGKPGEVRLVQIDAPQESGTGGAGAAWDGAVSVPPIWQQWLEFVAPTLSLGNP